jgi:hypothetical protein
LRRIELIKKLSLDFFVHFLCQDKKCNHNLLAKTGIYGLGWMITMEEVVQYSLYLQALPSHGFSGAKPNGPPKMETS